ncbi:DUF1826 domain-containing protein [Kistimonas asteriae]|uniref:DUF1826 domain-containing protein n=1 Tax=Kistimonas asteriae TaxID=517724 RepID=UPI001BAB8B13|nr:DUF1826 domain-containing protein [Kistimonas asteriae]
MRSAIAEQSLAPDAVQGDRTQHRFPSSGNVPTVLADIYQEDINIAIWQRTLTERLKDAVDDFLAANPQFESTMIVSPHNVHAAIGEASRGTVPTELAGNVAELVDMFCYLFEIKRAGLRLATLHRAMCPRFHVDRVPCRLVTTYCGVATEWLPHHAVNRSKLGSGNNGQPDAVSGLFQKEDDIQQLTCGDVALIKGERWVGNENAGLVHRSPEVPTGEHRLLLTLDVSD